MQEEGMIDYMVEKIQEKLMPVALKLNENRYIAAIRDGFFGITSILIIGSMFLLFASLPVKGYPELMEGILGANWANYFLVPYLSTMDIMGLFLILSMSHSLAKSHKVNTIAAQLLSLISFLILTPSITDADGARGIPAANFSASGLFLAMLATILSVEIYRFVIEKDWVIKMPESVPQNVSVAFSSLIPGFILVIVFNVIQILFSITDFGTAQDFIYTALQAPLTSFGTSLPAYLLSDFIMQALWIFGIHGSNVVLPMIEPLLLSNTVDNAAAYSAGTELPHIITRQFSRYVALGGGGATIGLVICMILFAKSKQYKSLGRLSLAPGFFNINEPVIFGLPIVLNPIMALPFIGISLILILLSYFVMSIGLVPYTNGLNVPWTTPPIIGGLLISGWRGAVWQVIEIILTVGMYYPFFRLVDQQAYEQEQGLETEAELN